MQNLPCCVFDNTRPVIAHIHYLVFVMLKPGCIGCHLSCCLAVSAELAISYCTTYLREQEQIQSADRFKRTINETRNAICSMLNQLYAYRQMPGVCEQLMEFYLACTQQLQDALAEVEFCWAAHCTEQCCIPDEYLHKIRPVFQKKFANIKSLLYKSDISQELALTIVAPVADFVAMKDAHRITNYDMIYMDKLLTALEEWGHNGPLTEETLSSLLLELNFNGKNFKEYYYRLLQQRLAKAGSLQEELTLLENLADKWYRHTLVAKPVMVYGEASVVEELIFWLVCQWRRRQQELLSKWDKGVEVTEEKPRGKIARRRIQYNDEPAVISAMHHILHATGLYKGSLKELFEHLAENAEFPNNKTVSASYLMKVGKTHKKKAHKCILFNYLPGWNELVGGKLPRQRS